jgi:myo-inositol-1(or 4)-monophosphatase
MMQIENGSPELALASQAAAAAGAVLMRHLREGFSVREKGASDLVSDADVAAEQTILALIRAAHPDQAILSEESHAQTYARDVPEHLWIVDPLDGTTNFAHGIPHFAVSIAYYRAGQAQCGVVYNPAQEDWYSAQRGAGAWFNGERMQVGPQQSLSDSLIGIGFYYDRGRMMEATLATVHKLFKSGIHGVRRFGAAALDLAHVARGMYSAFFEYQLSPWDFAAGRLLVEEAGGKVTTATGQELPFEKSSVLASNSQLHETMLGIIRESAGDLFESQST